MTKDRVQEDLKAWRELARNHMPDWRPTLQRLQQLDEGPHELGVALRSIARGWDRDDARWDVLMAVLEYYKREHARVAEQQIGRVRDLHHEEYGCCEHCTGLYGVPYPCPTILALTAEVPAATEGDDK